MSDNVMTKNQKYLPLLIFFIVSLIFSLPFLLKYSWIGVGDWELFVTMAAVPAKTILYFHQFPFWNPYIGGGNILFAHPEVGILSPFFLLILLFGAVGGLKIQMLLAYFLGLYGTFLFARTLNISKTSSYLVAFVYWGSSYFALHFSIGHVPFTHFCFLPWFLYFLKKIEDNPIYFFASSLTIALIILGNGAAIPFLYTCFFSGMFVLFFCIESKSYSLIKKYILSILAGLLLASAKFIPMYTYLTGNDWAGAADDYTPLAVAGKAFFSLDQWIFNSVHPEQHWGWHEYSAYLSPIVIILAILAIIFSFRKVRLWLLLALFFFVFGLGNFSDLSPWTLIVQLPGFSSIRSPGRAFQFVLLAIGIISAYGLDNLLARIKGAGNLKKMLPPLLITVVVLSNFFISLPALNSIEHKRPDKVRFGREFKQIIGEKTDIYNSFLKNRGSLMAPWLSAYKESRGLVTPDNQVLMEYIIEGQASIFSRDYTPNLVKYNIQPTTAGTIVFGIGFDSGWSLDNERSLFESNGLLTTRFKRNDSSFILSYSPPYFWLGLLISLMSIIACLLIYFNRQFLKRLEAILK